MFEQRTVNLAGIWQVTSDDGTSYDVRIPGTLDESNVGHADTLATETGFSEETDPIHELLREEGLLFEDEEEKEEEKDLTIYTRYTRKYTFTGPVCYSRTLSFREDPAKRYFLSVERARFLRLFVDAQEIPYFTQPTLVTPHVFEVTGLLTGDHIITLVCDNSFEGMPREEILASNMADDNTQTNWNGLLGEVIIREEEPLFVDHLTVRTRDGKASCYLEICGPEPGEEPLTSELVLRSNAFGKDYVHEITLTKKNQAFVFEGLELKEDVKLWDEGEGNLYEVTAVLGGAEKTVIFGARDIDVNSRGRITLNGRVIFLRGTTDSSVFPETGHMPMDRKNWEKVLNAYRDYGVNFVRFASACPPEAAFAVADELGMLLMPALSLADSDSCFMSQESRIYYRQEILRILRVYGNHPSFSLLGFGENVGFFDEGYEYVKQLIALARKTDSTRIYSLGTNVRKPGGFTKNDGDFVSFSALEELEPRVSDNMAVLSSDNGAFSLLPDFSELDLFAGFLEPKNIRFMEKKVEEAGLLLSWKRYMANSGENALLSYRQVIEENLRDYRLSGMTVFSLRDYPGKGTALVGMLNTHLQPKPGAFSDPKRFANFYSDLVLSAELPDECFVYGDHLSVKVHLSNFSKEPAEKELLYSVTGPGINIKGTLPVKNCPEGRSTVVGCIRENLLLDDHREELAREMKEKETEAVAAALEEDPFSDPLGILHRKLGQTEAEEKAEWNITEPITLLLSIRLGRLRADYPLYLYPSVLPICPEDVFEADGITADAVSILRSGGTVFLTPPATEEALPGSIVTGFSAMAFNEYLYPKRGTTMGSLIRKDHPVFRYFPTEEFADGRWKRLAVSRAVLLPRGITPMVGELDNCHECRRLGKLFEFRCLNGNVLFSSLGLKEKIHLPEGRNLLRSIYSYLESYDFSPSQVITLDELRTMIRDL